MNRRGFMARISAALGVLAVRPRVLEAADPLEFTGLQGVDWGSGPDSTAILEWEEGQVVRAYSADRLTATEIQAEVDRLCAEFAEAVVEANLSRLPTGHRTTVRSSLKGVKW